MRFAHRMGWGTKGFWTLVTGEEGRAQTSLEGCVWSLGGGGSEEGGHEGGLGVLASGCGGSPPRGRWRRGREDFLTATPGTQQGLGHWG